MPYEEKGCGPGTVIKSAILETDYLPNNRKKGMWGEGKMIMLGV
jgi:hypothetical protein